MDNSSEKNLITPCGLNCGSCAFYDKGEIQQHAQRLNELLEGFEHLASLLSDRAPEFSQYAGFSAILAYFGSAFCPGCRAQEVPDHMTGCSFRTCSLEKGVRYCGSCTEFPCSDAPKKYPTMAPKWEKNGKRMQEIGVEAFIEEINSKPRYKDYF